MDDVFGGEGAVLVLDVSHSTSGQFKIGAALWKPRRLSRPEDSEPLDTKRAAPSFTITLLEFVDLDSFFQLDSLLVRERPRWCFINPRIGAVERNKIDDLFERSGVQSTKLTCHGDVFHWPREPQKRAEAEAELATALNVPNLNGHGEFLSLTVCLNSLHCMLKELRSHGVLGTDMGSNQPNTFHELVLGRLDTCMRLDSGAADAIMLMPSKKDPLTSHGSLFGVLNHCKTSMGSRLLEAWLRQPLTSRELINARLDLVETFKNNVKLRGDLHDALKSAPDLELIVSKLRRSSSSSSSSSESIGSKKGRAASLADVHRLYNFALRNLPSFCVALDEFLADAEASSSGATEGTGAVLGARFGSPLRQCSADLATFNQLVEHVLDFDALPELRIKPEHRPELVELARDKERLLGDVREIHEHVQEEWASAATKGAGKGVIRLESHKDEGFVMRLPTASDEQLLRKLIPQIQILSILKSGVVFTTSELRDAGGAFLEVDRRFEEEQRDIADKFVATAATYVPVGETCARLVAELDVLLSFAHVAAHCPAGEYVRPTFVDDDDAGRIELLGARHPCVEMQPGVSFIACDYDLGRSDSRFQIVTGPNMGGKSTYIRGLGSLVAMAQVALNELVTHRSV